MKGKAMSEQVIHNHDRRAGCTRFPPLSFLRALAVWRQAILATLLVIIIGGGNLTLPIFLAAHPVLASSRAVSAVDAKSKPGQDICAPRLPWDTILQTAAHDLHLTIAQVR